MALDYIETSRKIIDAVGGVSNIREVSHCMTRLRLVLKDDRKVNDAAVNKIPGVKTVFKQFDQYQLVIGNEVADLCKAMNTLGDFDPMNSPEEAPICSPLQRLFSFVAGCMTPLLPAMLGTGMIKVVITLLTTFAGVDKASSTYIILNAMGDCFFFFLPVFLSYTIAKKIGGTPVLFMTVGAAMVYPELIFLLMGGSLELSSFMGLPCTYFFGVPVICSNYTSSVLPIFLMAPVMKAVEDFADRISPRVIKAFLKPLLFITICVPVALIVLGPIGNILGNLLAGVFNWMYHSCGWLTMGLVSALMPFIIMTGMHYALIPLYLNNLATLGFDALVLVTMFCSNLAQGGASLGVAAKTKQTETRSEGFASAVSAIIAGVTEPAMYGINLRYQKPMIAAVIAAGVSGLFCGLTGVSGYTMGGSPSLLTLITFIGGEAPMRNLMYGVIAAAISIILSFTLSFLLYREAEIVEEKTPEEPVPAPEEKSPFYRPLVQRIVLTAPLTGDVVALSDVPDQAFASGALGEGAAIIPTDGRVCAPCNGIIAATMDTEHAISLVSDEGLELLIHVGLNTAELDGKYYEYKVSKGSKVKEGDVLIEFDIAGITAAGYTLHTPVVVTNYDQYVSIKTMVESSVKVGEDFLSIV